MDNSKNVLRFADGEVCMWIEDGGSIHLRAASSHGDPAELTARDARDIAAALVELSQQLDED